MTNLKLKRDDMAKAGLLLNEIEFWAESLRTDLENGEGTGPGLKSYADIIASRAGHLSELITTAMEENE